jgi:hypothetical protein
MNRASSGLRNQSGMLLTVRLSNGILAVRLNGQLLIEGVSPVRAMGRCVCRPIAGLHNCGYYYQRMEIPWSG